MLTCAGTPSPPVSRNRSPHLPPPLKRRQSTPSSNFDPKPNLSRRQPSVGRVSRKSSVADEDESWSDCMEEDEAETEIDEEAPPRSRARSGSQSSRQERLGHWTPEEKQQLLELVHHKDPCGAADWEVCICYEDVLTVEHVATMTCLQQCCILRAIWKGSSAFRFSRTCTHCAVPMKLC